MMGPGPAAVNQLPTPRATLKVSNIPSFVTGDDFSRLMLQLEGCVDARLLGRWACSSMGNSSVACSKACVWAAVFHPQHRVLLIREDVAPGCLKSNRAGSLAATRWAMANFRTR